MRIKHCYSTANHPSTNRMPERAEGTLKFTLNALIPPITKIQKAPISIIQMVRNPLQNGKIPAKMFLSRNIHTLLNILSPPSELHN